MAKKKRKVYGEYTAIIGGRLYASVNIPNGDGTYKRKRKRVPNEDAARQWASEQLHAQRHGTPLTDGRYYSPKLADW